MADERDEIIRELVAALEPFAVFGQLWLKRMDGEGAAPALDRVLFYSLTASHVTANITVADFRRVVAALERAKEQTP